MAKYFSAALFISLSLLSCQDEETDVINPEPTEVIEIDSTLTDLISRAVSEEDSEGHINCLDFEYPISISIFDTSFDIANTEDINSDAQFSSFLETLEDGIIASINYPITAVFAGEDVIEIIENKGLLSILLDAEGSECNVTVQDCTQASVTASFLDCKWSIRTYTANTEYVDYIITFNENSALFMSDNAGVISQGIWEVFEDDDQLILKISNQLIDFSWQIVECGDETVQASGDDDTIVLIKDCTIETEEDPEITAAKEIVIGCTWQMDRHNVNGERTFTTTTGITFEFFEDGTFIHSDSVTTYNGDWAFQKDEDGNLVLTLEPSQSLPEYIDYDFTMGEFREGFMIWTANNTDQEIITGFEQDCTIEEDPEITAAKELVINEGCAWYMDRYIVNEERDTTIFNHTFEFFEDGSFILNDSVTGYDGDWAFEKDEEGNLVLILDPYQSFPEYLDYDFTMGQFREGYIEWFANDTDQEIITSFEQDCN